MKHEQQLRLEWQRSNETRDANEVVLDPETTERVVSLMVSALIVVVHSAEEADDER